MERCAASEFGELTSFPMFKQREAIIRLLQDSDPDTVNLTKQQLVRGGAGAIPDLRDLLSTADQQVALHVREMLTEIEIRHAKEAFEEICGRISSLADLERGCWYLAQIFQPGVDIESYQKTIDVVGPGTARSPLALRFGYFKSHGDGTVFRQGSRIPWQRG